MKFYLHLMSGTSVEASCEIEGSAELAVEELINEAIGLHYDMGFRLEYVSKFDEEIERTATIFDLVVLDGELDYEKSWSEDDIEDAGYKEIELSSHIFNGYRRVAVIDLSQEQTAA
ncbi:hypothetical protein GFL58_30675 [Rhizobium leguminosarum bv. viciae]|uniref:hypothetical protein n=1 Tax=Rhizobium leguminosarum TaxID=384 RepID=UPI00143F6478|nr:hypothetical protein [Rhizobium leguminosarum]NKM65284.1 hypothetical protein [Rhizobium leguminosarum bv. viciae]